MLYGQEIAVFCNFSRVFVNTGNIGKFDFTKIPLL